MNFIILKRTTKIIYFLMDSPYDACPGSIREFRPPIIGTINKLSWKVHQLAQGLQKFALISFPIFNNCVGIVHKRCIDNWIDLEQYLNVLDKTLNVFVWKIPDLLQSIIWFRLDWLTFCWIEKLIFCLYFQNNLDN